MKIVAYYRVSTKRQGIGGLGIEGQRAAVEAFAKTNGAKIVGSYKEVESGKRKDRPEFAKALGHARLSKATLVVAKLDRLARNVAFTASLMESGVDFVACDNQHANRLTIHILAAVAEGEAKAVSERTKAALAAASRKGVALGSAREGHWDGREDRRTLGLKRAVKAASAARSEAANEAYGFLLADISERRANGDTLDAIASWLNDEGHQTRAGKPFTATAIHRLLKRAG
jgi:DNA invertase Pin-like site-specific DNA recombinase